MAQVSGIVSFISMLMLLAALFLLWWKSRSIWLLIAMAGELITLGFRALLLVAPSLAGNQPTLFTLWSLVGLLATGGLLGYAVTETTRSGD